MWSKNDNLNDNLVRQNLYCPVCKVLLGGRYDHQDRMLTCPECNWTYHFKPLNRIPHAIRKGEEKKCGCGRCGN